MASLEYMGKIKKFFRSGDAVERFGSNAREIDRILLELGKLYVERQKAWKDGEYEDLLTITKKIATLKTQLAKL